VTTRQDWLARRRELITASDVAAILGEDTHRGALAAYAEKVGGLEVEDSLPMRRGRRWEGVIAEEYAEQTGREVRDLGPFVIQQHPTIPWLGATLDRVTLRGDYFGPLQIKMVLGSAQDWRDGAPAAYQIQCQIEAACFGSSWCSLAGLIGPGPLAVYDFERDDEFLRLALPKLEEFRERVLRRDPPPADATPGTSAAARRLWAVGDGKTVALDEHAQAVADVMLYRQACADEDECAAGLAEVELRRRLEGASFGALPDGRFVRLRQFKNEKHRRLDIWTPKVRRNRG
jgi:putative phage-type endonuclease